MKENLEKSLKRYLKRKVKITLGFITAFAIMGNVGLAVEISGDEELYNKLIKEKQNNIKIRDENIKGLGSNFETTTKYDGNMVINNENGKNKISLKNISGQFVNMEIENKFISSSIKNKIDSLSGEYIKVNNNEIKVLSENNGIIIGQASNAVQATGSEVNKIINNGILYGGQSLELGNDKAINNGIIYFSRADRAAQYTTKENAEIINNGYLRANQKSSGQYSSGINSKLYNYGVIEGYNGQQITKSDSILYNYGIIESLNCGQLNNGGISYNYGKIYAKNNDGINVSEGKTYNFGLIEVNNGYAMNGAGEKYNYGVIKSSNENIFYEANPSNPKQNILNKGIIISENAENLKDKIWVTNSALFDNDYNLLTLNAISIENEKLNSDDFKSSNEEEKDKQVAAIVNGSAELSGIFDGKTIASVVHGNKENTTVFTLGDGETVLKDTSLVGYFENEGGGTLLKVEADKTLTLDGETKITAVKDLQNGDIGEVIALELEKDSTLNIMSDDVEINGIIKGLGENARINAYSLKSEISSEDTSVFLSNIKDENLTDYVAENNFTEATLSGNKLDNLTFDFSNTAKDKENTVIIKDGVSINTGGSFTDNTEYETNGNINKVNIIIENIDTFAENLDEIKLGDGENILTVNNSKDFNKNINLGTGNDDKFVVNYNQSLKDENGYNTFNYNVTNAETVELSGGNWKVGTGSIKFDDMVKAGENHNATLKMTNGAIFDITLSGVNGGSDLANAIKEGGLIVKNNTDLALSTDETGKIRYQISENGLDFAQLSTEEYSISSDANVVAPIFNVSSDGKNGVDISVKTAQEAGVGGYKPIYDAIIKELSSDVANKAVIDRINSMDDTDDIIGLVANTDTAAQAYYTAGTVVTKNITDSYVSAVEEFGKKANKGEWIATAKYINSDTEFDGGSKVKGYDRDINSAVGIIEYGVTDNTSYGAVFGGGKTEIDINGGGSLEGDNFYLGAYVKHRTENKVDIIGNIGVVKSDLDSELTQEFKFTSGDINLNGKSNVDGTADSSAITASIMAKKNYYVTDTVRFEPLASLRYTLIKQDTAENKDMGFEIQEQDASVFEATFGLNTVKEVRLEKGILELNAGAKYTFAGTSEDEDVRYNLYSSQDLSLTLDGAELGDNKGTAFVGFDYEHENGVGFNGKYEMMWSDSGDDSRITAGVYYRF